MHRIEPVFIPHGLPETLLDCTDSGFQNMDQVEREFQTGAILGDTLRHNIATVLKFAVEIENQFSRILSAYLICIDNERQNFLDSALIRASWCTFNIKGELGLKVLSSANLVKSHCTQDPRSIPREEQDLPITNSEIKEVRKNIKKLGLWRNALAHGLITTSDDNEHRLYVNYFTHSQEKQELNDVFWADIEKLMHELSDFIVPARMRMEIFAKGIRMDLERANREGA